MAGVMDWYGNPSLSRQGILSGDLSMYAIGRDNLMNLNVTYGTDGRPEQEYMFVPQSSEVISCYFFPYLDYSHIRLKSIMMKKRFLYVLIKQSKNLTP